MRALTFGSVCSGIEAASVAWYPLGWRAAWFSEIEAFPSALLAHHYPLVPNLGDMTKIPAMVRARQVAAPDVLCGGTPCQAFSIAGLRRSLDDARGNLSLIFCEIADEIDARRAADGAEPAIIFWENVPGVLNTKDNAFGCFLAGLAGEDDPLVPAGDKWTNAGCVFGPKRAVAWRVLDAQYFGVAQRRRRVFVVASAREGFDPTEVLFEFDGVRRDSAPRRDPGQEPAAGTLRSTDGGCDVDHARAHQLLACVSNAEGSAGLPFLTCSNLAKGVNNQTPLLAFSCKDYGADVTADLAPTMRAMGHGKSHANAGVPPAIAFRVHGENSSAMQCNGVANVADPVEVARCLDTNGGYAASQGGNVVLSGVCAMAFQERGRTEGTSLDTSVEVAYALLAPSGGSRSQERNILTPQMAVRRLTPRECERLQGFPDDYTLVPHRGKPAADGPRYKALGNSWAVPNVRWIGARIVAHLRQLDRIAAAERTAGLQGAEPIEPAQSLTTPQKTPPAPAAGPVDTRQMSLI